jgi:hypothetical protein
MPLRTADALAAFAVRVQQVPDLRAWHVQALLRRD